MATINGITIKSYKTFRGIEYPVCREANIWKNGKKIGTFTEDSWGGEADMTDGLEEAVKASALQYQTACKGSKYYEYEADAEVFISHILTLVEYEKIYKDICKKGFPFVLFVGNDIKYHAWGFKKEFDYHDEKKLHSTVKEAIKKEFPKGNYIMWSYSSEADFNITVDEKHHVPKYIK